MGVRKKENRSRTWKSFVLFFPVFSFEYQNFFLIRALATIFRQSIWALRTLQWGKKLSLNFKAISNQPWKTKSAICEKTFILDWVEKTFRLEQRFKKVFRWRFLIKIFNFFRLNTGCTAQNYPVIPLNQKVAL